MINFMMGLKFINAKKLAKFDRRVEHLVFEQFRACVVCNVRISVAGYMNLWGTLSN